MDPNSLIKSYYGSVNYRVDANLLANTLSTSCWYVDAMPSGPVSVGGRFYFANGQSVGVSALGQISIYKPTTTGFASATAAVTLYINNGGLVLGIDVINHHYIDFNVTINSKYGGTAGYTQLFNDYSFPTAYGVDILDTAELYPFPGPVSISQTPPKSPASNLVELDDAPWEPCESGYPGLGASALNVQFTDYLRFTPGGPGDIYVTLGILTWAVNASAAQSSNGTWATGATQVIQPSYSSSHQFPTWLYSNSR
jgi:hypothetical protein